MSPLMVVGIRSGLNASLGSKMVVTRGSLNSPQPTSPLQGALLDASFGSTPRTLYCLNGICEDPVSHHPLGCGSAFGLTGDGRCPLAVIRAGCSGAEGGRDAGMWGPGRPLDQRLGETDEGKWVPVQSHGARSNSARSITPF